MLEKIIKDYFSFTRKERLAVMILVFLTIIIILLPYCINEQQEVTDKMAFDTLRVQMDRISVSKKEPRKTAPDEVMYGSDPGRDRAYVSKISKEASKPVKAALFYFDPNTLSIEGWKKLGVHDRTIQTIQNYISKGGGFKNRTDLGIIYGLHPDEAERLMPYVKIAVAKTTSFNDYHTSNLSTHASHDPPLRTSLVPLLLDINTADTTEWIALPGIGSKLASRIVRFREKLGGFYSIDQLSEIYGLPDTTFQKLRPGLKINTLAVPFININTIQVNDLKQHPYMKWNIANAIIEFRKQHGDFKSLDDLRKIDVFTEEIYRKIAPYLKVE
ncbi:MAG: helix-hairpin-helix domain-containing protein [Chitinophagaceae bacterium]